jgi:hypothetical protein
MSIITISPLGYDSKKATIYQVQTQGKDFSTDVLDLTVESPELAIASIRKRLKAECIERAMEQLREGKVATIDLDACLEGDS